MSGATAPVSAAGEQALLEAARATLRSVVDEAPRPEPPTEPPELAAPGASFVTLKRHGALRGCIGSLEAHRPLGADVVHNAEAAARHDPRFPPLTAAELTDLDLHIAVLTRPEPLVFVDEAELIRQLSPGADGLILEACGQRGTFLPAVWESLPEPVDFLAQLRRKAGLATDFPLERARVQRYRSHDFGAPFTADTDTA